MCVCAPVRVRACACAGSLVATPLVLHLVAKASAGLRSQESMASNRDHISGLENGLVFKLVTSFAGLINPWFRPLKLEAPCSRHVSTFGHGTFGD